MATADPNVHAPGIPAADVPPLVAEGLTKLYRGRSALAEVGLVVRRGEVHGLLGPNGAGKTTLLRALLGLLQPDAGSVRLFGVDLAPGAGLPDGVAGYVDAPGFYPYLTGRQNLRLLGRLDGGAGGASRGADDRALADAGLGDVADLRVSAYSAGMRQRLALAAALLREPRLLLLDEPTSALDPAAAEATHALLRRLAGRGVAVVLSSHRMEEVEALCASVTILREGRVAYSGSVDALRATSSLPRYRMATAHDDDALAVGGERLGLDVTLGEGGLLVRGHEADLDALTIALGKTGIGIRGLAREERSLASLFLDLTGAAGPVAEPRVAAPAPPRAFAWSGTFGGTLAAARVELAKLRARAAWWLLVGACVVLPFGFAVALRLVGRVPDDTLFGRSALTSGFALPLVVLGFAPELLFPALAGVLAGDLFPVEDRARTWATLLTRSVSRDDLFLGKALLGLALTVAVTTLLGASSLAAGALVIGADPLLGLSGTTFPPGAALGALTLAWAATLVPVLAFTLLALFVSVATRSSAAGVGVPVAVGFAMSLASLVPGGGWPRQALLTAGLSAWHGLFAAPPFRGPLVQGFAVSAVYGVTCLVGARLFLRRRELGA